MIVDIYHFIIKAFKIKLTYKKNENIKNDFILKLNYRNENNTNKILS